MTKTTRILTSAFLILLIGALYFINAFGSIENYYEDLIYQHGHAVPGDIKIIAIDNKTLEELGPYPTWDRTIYANLIEKLYESENGPQVIGLDIVFSGESDPDSDLALTEAVKGRNIVLASKLDISTRSNMDSHSYEYFVSEEETAFDDLQNACNHGFTNAFLDEDGYLRRAYTSVESDGKTYDSFAVSVLKAASYDLPDLKTVIELSYTGNPGDFEVVSLADVLNGNVPASHFKDSIVLVGAYEDGLMDSYTASVNHKNPMYGVEIQANTIEAIRSGYILKPFSGLAFLLLLATFMIAFSVLVYRNGIGISSVIFTVYLGLYALLSFTLFKLNLITLPILYVPLGLALLYLAAIIVRYVESQKQLAEEMKQTLFSMADSMAEAIEGRTPYNANHTKNVAKRSVEMLDYINELHRQGRTEMHFSANDKDQMYLAAMLHDIGKMDVPLEVMDKPTKLGVHEEQLKQRLEIVKLHIENDILSGRIDRETGNNSLDEINGFLGRLELYNSGKPLSDEDLKLIKSIGNGEYKKGNGDSIPYLTEEELDDLSIRSGTLTDKERKIMQSHVGYTNKILSHVHFGQSFDKVCEMASNHHELLNGSGYPNGLENEQIDVMTRILTVMDIYDSLIADDRPYKKPKSNKVAFEIIEEEAEAGKLDKEIVKIAKELYLEEEQ